MVWSVKLYAGAQSKSVSLSTVLVNNVYGLMNKSAWGRSGMNCIAVCARI